MPAFIPTSPISPISPTFLSPLSTSIHPRNRPLFKSPRSPTCHRCTPLTASTDLPSDTSVSIPDTNVQSDTRTTGHNLHLEIDGKRICYDYFEGTGPTVVFLPGFFDSRYRQSKANALEIFAKRKGQAILVEEYCGIGRSEGDFVKEGTLSRWIRDTVGLLDAVVGQDGKVVLVGMGIGGWIGLHVALRLPGRVVGIVGVNPSVDFTEDLVLPSMSEEEREEIEKGGSVDLKWGYTSYPIGKALVEDARKWLVLRGERGGLQVDCPVRLVQGMMDEEVPPERVLRLVERIRSEDVVLQFVKYGDHMMEGEDDLRRMWEAVCELSDRYFEYDLTSPTSG